MNESELPVGVIRSLEVLRGPPQRPFRQSTGIERSSPAGPVNAERAARSKTSRRHERVIPTTLASLDESPANERDERPLAAEMRPLDHLR
jgi:hypothetical protein